MFTFQLFNGWFIGTVGTLGAATSRLPYFSRILMFYRSSPSSSPLVTLYHSIIDCIKHLSCRSTGYASRNAFKTTSWICCREQCLVALVSGKLKVWVKQLVNSSQVVISLCNSADTYHDRGISSNMWKKAWTHSSFGQDAHKVWHSIRWLPGLPIISSLSSA